MASYVNSKCKVEISEEENGLYSISQQFVLDAFQFALRKALNVGIEPNDIRNVLLAMRPERHDVYHPCPVLKTSFPGSEFKKIYWLTLSPLSWYTRSHYRALKILPIDTIQAGSIHSMLSSFVSLTGQIRINCIHHMSDICMFRINTTSFL